jgi:hypothetical protein
VRGTRPPKRHSERYEATRVSGKKRTWIAAIVWFVWIKSEGLNWRELHRDIEPIQDRDIIEINTRLDESELDLTMGERERGVGSMRSLTHSNLALLYQGDRTWTFHTTTRFITLSWGTLTGSINTGTNISTPNNIILKNWKFHRAASAILIETIDTG